jgi:hypothetical protein
MQYTLNDDQAAALRAVADMLPIQGSSTPPETPVTLIHGVFGAGLFVCTRPKVLKAPAPANDTSRGCREELPPGGDDRDAGAPI